MKVCNKCNIGKENGDFRKSNQANDGLTSSCKKCLQSYDVEIYDKRKERVQAKTREDRKINPDKYRNYDLVENFNITLGEYNEMLKLQNYVCAICKQPEKRKTKTGKVNNLSVDHCHLTGEIRGILCNCCNRAIGLLKDNSTVLKEAVKYLDCNENYIEYLVW